MAAYSEAKEEGAFRINGQVGHESQSRTNRRSQFTNLVITTICEVAYKGAVIYVVNKLL